MSKQSTVEIDGYRAKALLVTFEHNKELCPADTMQDLAARAAVKEVLEAWGTYGHEGRPLADFIADLFHTAESIKGYAEEIGRHLEAEARREKQGRLADNFTSKELLGLMTDEMRQELYARAAILMEWTEEDA